MHLIPRPLLALVLSLSTLSVCAEAPILQPGGIGDAPKTLSAEEAIQIANTRYSADDLRFMRDMIPHHQQALDMSVLAGERTNNPEIIDAAGRIKASQGDEIAFMERWLEQRGEPLEAPHSEHHSDTHLGMQGMATPDQMTALAAASASAFDRLYLTLMITHHEGALTMVEELLEQPGAAYDPVLFEFTTDITNSQSAEIDRMNALLVGLSDDPRAGLAAGLFDAEEAIWNLTKVAVLPKPAGFYDPENPGELPAARFMATTGEEEAPQSAASASDGDGDGDDVADEEENKPEERYPLLSFSNTDIAFQGDIMVAGSYHGFNVYQLDANGIPELKASVVCPGGQGDVSLVEHLLIMSVEETRGRVDCGLQGVQGDISEERFRGLRIFDLSDITQPIQVGAVQTCRGSHTHSVVSGPGEDRTVLVYNSGISRIRKEEELEGCIDASLGDDRTALFRIDVVEIPLDNPGAARIIDSPAVFADPETGALAGLWRGGDHGDDTQETERTDQCHDITVFPTLNLAAGACSGNGILFDITDPVTPKRIDAVTDTGFAYWHSATFNNDGSKVLFTDEWGGGTQARCRAFDPLNWGADAFYDIEGDKLVFKSHYKLPAPQLKTENCVAHNGSIIPVPGRDLFVQAWYQGGLSIIDFTDSANPIEIAYFDRGPIDSEDLVTGGYWSTYWYGGFIYGTEIIRGIDVFALTASEFLSQNEIEAAQLAEQGDVFNPQQQFPVTWPAEPVVAKAYLDQLIRSRPELSEALAALYETLELAEVKLGNNMADAAMAATLKEWATTELLSAAIGLQTSLRAIGARLTSSGSVPPPDKLISQATP
jgi:uncharacterized protein (DUF305 family)